MAAASSATGPHPRRPRLRLPAVITGQNRSRKGDPEHRADANAASEIRFSNTCERGFPSSAERSPDAQIFRDRLKALEALVGLADSMAESFLKGGMVNRLGLKVLVAAAARKHRKDRP
jgi:hypothetical protein